MEKITQIEQLLLRSRRLPWVLIGVALAILAITILLAALQLRAGIREQIAGREGEVLQAVALTQLKADAQEIELLGPITDPANQLAAVLKTSRLRGVVGTRLFDANGKFVEAFPPDVREAALEARSLPILNRLKSVSRFLPAVPLTRLFLPEDDTSEPDRETMPLLEVNVPLHIGTDHRLIGIAQFNIEGSGVAAEFAQLDRRLVIQGLIAFFVGGGTLTITIAWAFRRLRQAHQLLAERTSRLLRANQELALAAKTSAVGAITSHLIHGLKNPLSGLQNFMSNLAPADADSSETDWSQAVAATRRIQTLINQVVNVLREEQGSAHYEITLAELADLLIAKAHPLSIETGVKFVANSTGDAVLPNRAANLIALILVNLAQNALQATPRGGVVTLSLIERDDSIVCEMRDEGPGFPLELAENLFAPCQSTKEGGSGIGLAISKQLAGHLGATLKLTRNGLSGCAFVLTVPLPLASEESTGGSSTRIW